MGKGRYLNKKPTKVPFWPFLIIIVILAVAAVMFFYPNTSVIPGESEAVTTLPVESQEKGQTQAAVPTDAAESELAAQPEKTVTADETATAEEIKTAEKAGNTESTKATEASKDADETQNPTQTQPTELIESLPPVEIVERADAEYEKWLSAAQVVCVSMEYPDFQLDGVYTTSATALENKYDSEGAYIIFTSGGNKMAFHSKALEKERSATGTIDISTEAIGYATFDKIDPASINVSSLDQIELEELSDLISQSLLISIYTH